MKEKIVNKVAEAIEGRFGKGYSVQFYEIVKDKKGVIPAAVICETGATTGIAVHIGKLLESLEHKEISLADAVKEVVRIYGEILNIGAYADMIARPDRGEILTRVTYQLVNTEKHSDKLLNLPHKEMLDLSVIYKAVVKDNGIETASIIVDKAICKRFGIGEEELDDAANLNTEMKGFPARPFKSVFPGVLDEMDSTLDCLWVITSRKKCEGAAVMFYPYYFRRLARRLGADLYVMPSSRHEVVATPVQDGIPPEELKSIASRINSIRITHEETISKYVYR